MNRNFLGDEKDIFKWDYHDFLVRKLNYKLFNIALMRTDFVNSNQSKFPAKKQEIIKFCKDFRERKKNEDNGIFKCLKENLQKIADNFYKINFHKKDLNFVNNKKDREKYFSEIKAEKQVLLLDPDTGFEPQNKSKKHICYKDIKNILNQNQFSKDSVISVFQYSNRESSFPDHFKKIKEKIKEEISLEYSKNLTAIYWHSVMFITISKNETTIKEVRKINKEYAEKYPVKTIEK